MGLPRPARKVRVKPRPKVEPTPLRDRPAEPTRAPQREREKVPA